VRGTGLANLSTWDVAVEESERLCIFCRVGIATFFLSCPQLLAGIHFSNQDGSPIKNVGDDGGERFLDTNVGNDGEDGFPLPACVRTSFVGMMR